MEAEEVGGLAHMLDEALLLGGQGEGREGGQEEGDGEGEGDCWEPMT